jgi:TolB protein
MIIVLGQNREKLSRGVLASFFTLGCLVWGCAQTPVKPESKKVSAANAPPEKLSAEKYLSRAKQLTFGGVNSMPTWSMDGRWISFQHFGAYPLRGLAKPELPCEQIYKIKKDGSEILLLSSGKGSNVSPSFLPGGERVLFSSTVATQPQCVPAPGRSTFGTPYSGLANRALQIYGVKLDGTDPIPLDPAAPTAYNSEARVCHDGSVIFTSDRTGNIELFGGKLDHFGTFNEIRQITSSSEMPEENVPTVATQANLKNHEDLTAQQNEKFKAQLAPIATPGIGSTGYNGQASFSPDCKKIVWSAYRPHGERELAEYGGYLAAHELRLKNLELWVSDKNGANARPLTQLGAFSLAPVFSPDGRKILFTSNLERVASEMGPLGYRREKEKRTARAARKSSRPRNGRKVKAPPFHLYEIDTETGVIAPLGSGESSEQFATFSPDGKSIVFSSNRNSVDGEFNLFILESDLISD